MNKEHLCSCSVITVNGLKCGGLYFPDWNVEPQLMALVDIRVHVQAFFKKMS